MQLMYCDLKEKDLYWLHWYEKMLSEDPGTKTAEYICSVCMNYATVIEGETGNTEIFRGFLSCAWEASNRLPDDERRYQQKRIQKIADQITEK